MAAQQGSASFNGTGSLTVMWASLRVTQVAQEVLENYTDPVSIRVTQVALEVLHTQAVQGQLSAPLAHRSVITVGAAS